MVCCGLCHRLISNEQDTATVYDYPTVGRGGCTVHYLCLRIRTCQGGNIDATKARGHGAYEHAASHVPAACGYCGVVIAAGQDCVEFKMCEHTAVHLTCMMRFDFTRRMGCVFCYGEAKAAAAMDAWHGDNSKKSVLIQSYIASAQPTAAAAPTVRKSAVSDGVMLHTNSLYGLFVQKVAPGVINEQYASQKYRMNEPVHSAALRRIVHELNIDYSDPLYSHIPDQGPDIYTDLMLEHKYTVSDLVQVGLTLPIVLYNNNTARIFVQHYFFDHILPKAFIGKHGLLTLALAGIPLAHIFERSRGSTVADAQWLEFSIPVCLAAGVELHTIKRFLDGVTSHIDAKPSTESVMPYFGATREILALFH